MLEIPTVDFAINVQNNPGLILLLDYENVLFAEMNLWVDQEQNTALHAKK